MPFILYLQVTNGDGVWVRLEKDSMSHYCHETGGEAWSLARGNDDILYLQHEADLLEEAQENQGPFNFGPGIASTGMQPNIITVQYSIMIEHSL